METSATNDPFSYMQYYLDVLNIPEAWKQISVSKEVIVAVIDDGVNINHPDLTGSIWVDPGAKYGSSKIKNFAGDEIPDNFPTGEH
jgi:subtilisin family serine protease